MRKKKLEKSNCDKLKNPIYENPKTQIVTKLKKKKTKLKYSNCDKNSKKVHNIDCQTKKKKIVTKLENSNCENILKQSVY